MVIGLVLIFGLLRLLSGLGEPTTHSSFYTSHVVLVGVTGRYQPDATDDKIISAHAQDASKDAVEIAHRNIESINIQRNLGQDTDLGPEEM